MRVITGTARGRKLIPPSGNDTRPTTEMVKEAVMSMIQFETPGAVFLDLFAGSGQMGIEAISRGARHCIFVDQSRAACELVRKNLENTKFTAQAKVVTSDASLWVRGATGPIDIAFIDPPYGEGLPQQLLPGLAEIMRENGIILVETGKEEKLPEKAGEFLLVREYIYGKKKISRYEKAQEE